MINLLNRHDRSDCFDDDGLAALSNDSLIVKMTYPALELFPARNRGKRGPWLTQGRWLMTPSASRPTQNITESCDTRIKEIGASVARDSSASTAAPLRQATRRAV